MEIEPSCPAVKLGQKSRSLDGEPWLGFQGRLSQVYARVGSFQPPIRT